MDVESDGLHFWVSRPPAPAQAGAKGECRHGAIVATINTNVMDLRRPSITIIKTNSPFLKIS